MCRDFSYTTDDDMKWYTHFGRQRVVILLMWLLPDGRHRHRKSGALKSDNKSDYMERAGGPRGVVYT